MFDICQRAWSLPWLWVIGTGPWKGDCHESLEIQLSHELSFQIRTKFLAPCCRWLLDPSLRMLWRAWNHWNHCWFSWEPHETSRNMWHIVALKAETTIQAGLGPWWLKRTTLWLSSQRLLFLLSPSDKNKDHHEEHLQRNAAMPQRNAQLGKEWFFEQPKRPKRPMPQAEFVTITSAAVTESRMASGISFIQTLTLTLHARIYKWPKSLQPLHRWQKCWVQCQQPWQPRTFWFCRQHATSTLRPKLQVFKAHMATSRTSHASHVPPRAFALGLDNFWESKRLGPWFLVLPSGSEFLFHPISMFIWVYSADP